MAAGERYTKTAIVLHWVIALGIIANVMLAWIWPYVADEHVRPMIDKHKSIGVTVLGLAILRLLWRLAHTPPPYPAAYKPWERRASHIVHWGLYFVIFAMPLTGWIMDSAWKDAATHPMYWFGTFEWKRIAYFQHLPVAEQDRLHSLFGAFHEYLAWVIFGLFVLHVGGAWKHQFEGHRELQRMGVGRS